MNVIRIALLPALTLLATGAQAQRAVDVAQIGAVRANQAGSATTTAAAPALLAATATSGSGGIAVRQQGDGSSTIAAGVDPAGLLPRMPAATAATTSANVAFITQAGVGGTIVLDQNGADNTARLTQVGDDNRMTATQNGRGNLLDWTQNGNHLPDLAITQSGNQTLYVVQTGGGR